MHRNHLWTIVGFWIFAFSCAVASSDTIELKNGRKAEGEVVEDREGRPLVFRHRVGKQWKTTEVDRATIRRYTREEGDQSDGGARPNPLPASNEKGPSATLDTTTGPDKIRTIGELAQIIASTLPPLAAEPNEVVLLKLRGPFLPADVRTIGEVISTSDISAMLAAAQKRSPKAIVLYIDSPGGLVSEMDQIVELVLDAQSTDRVVAWVEQGASAAALTALACKEIIAMPNARMGAATAVVGNEAAPAPKTAMDQKVEALRDARRRQVADLTNRSPLIQLAMEKPEMRLWYHPEEGFSKNTQFGEGWEQVDESSERPLALAARELVRYGIARGIAGSREELLQTLDLPIDCGVVEIDLLGSAIQAKLRKAKDIAFAGDAAFSQAKAEYNKKLTKVFDNILAARTLLKRIHNTKDGYQPADLESLKLAISRCKMPPMKDDFRELIAAQSPEELIAYEVNVDSAKSCITNASRACRTNNLLPTQDINRELQLALEFVMRAMNKGELPRPPN